MYASVPSAAAPTDKNRHSEGTRSDNRGDRSVLTIINTRRVTNTVRDTIALCHFCLAIFGAVSRRGLLTMVRCSKEERLLAISTFVPSPWPFSTKAGGHVQTMNPPQYARGVQQIPRSTSTRTRTRTTTTTYVPLYRSSSRLSGEAGRSSRCRSVKAPVSRDRLKTAICDATVSATNNRSPLGLNCQRRVPPVTGETLGETKKETCWKR